MHGLSLDEEEAQKSQTSRLWARAEHKSKVERVAAKNVKKNPSSNRGKRAVTVDKQQKIEAREKATTEMKRKLTGDEQRDNINTHKPLPPMEDWMKIEEQERLHNLELIRKQRRK